jgi:hypothetical protein
VKGPLKKWRSLCINKSIYLQSNRVPKCGYDLRSNSWWVLAYSLFIRKACVPAEGTPSKLMVTEMTKLCKYISYVRFENDTINSNLVLRKSFLSTKKEFYLLYRPIVKRFSVN